MTRAELDAAILAAHAAGDGAVIAGLYAQAGAAATNENEAAFFWTNGYIFALEAGLPLALELHQKLVALGREA